MTSATLVNTIGSALLAHTVISSGTITPGASFNVAGKIAGLISVMLGRTATTALTNEFLLKFQVSMEASGDENWRTRYEFTTASGKTACVAPTLNGSTSAGATTFVVSSATGLAKGSKLYLRETGTPGDSEFCEIKDISGTTVTPMDPLTRAHTNGITITSLAELPAPWTESFAGVKRCRIVGDGGTNTSGQTVDLVVKINTLDSVDF